MAPPRHTGQEAAAVDPAPLGSPLSFTFSGQTAPNRFLKAAMTERVSSWDAKDLTKRGIPSPELVNLYRRWGEGGWGIILTGNVMVAPDQLEAAGNPVIPRGAPFEGERFEAFRAVAAAAKQASHGTNGSKSLVVMQVSHPGRQVAANIQPNPISASDVQLEGTVLGMTFGKPRAMEHPVDFETVVDSFAHAAEYAHRAGYDGVQLHGAHGYLLAQFLSPTTNKRTDSYGGSILNRGRIIFEIAAEIRKRVGQTFSLAIKLNSVEFQDAGFSPEDCRDLCAELEKAGFDWVELSGGTYQHLAFTHRRESTRRREAYFLEFAELITPQLGGRTKVYVTGGFRSTAGMVAALKSVDGVGLGRPAADEPDLPNKLLSREAEGALKLALDEDDIGLTNVAAGTQ